MITMSDVLRDLDSLPTLSYSVARLFALVNDDRATARDFEEVMRPDPAITANLLALANSAYFGLTRQVTSVRQAVSLLGTRRVLELAASAAFSRVLPPRIPGYEIDARAFWKHSIGVAALAERLAHELSLKSPDLTFTAGLLHDMGKLVIGSHLMRMSREVLYEVRKNGASLVQAERAILGTDHVEVGELVAQRWNLPPEIGWTARWHHDPNAAPTDFARRLVDLIHAADALAHTLGIGADAGELARTIEKDVIDRLGIKVQKLERAASETVDQIDSLSEFLTKGSGGA